MKTQLISLVIMSIVSLTGLPAFAQNAKTAGTNSSYSGSECLPLSSSYNYNIKNGGLYNTGSSTRQWDCPITRLFISGIIFTGSIYVQNLSKTSLSCALNVRGTKGNTIKVFTKKASPSSSVQTLEFANLQYAVGNYHYHFLCSVPGKNGSKQSGIVGYDVIEVGVIVQ